MDEKRCNNGVGRDAIERLRFLASLPLAGTGQREGGKKTQPFNRFQSRLGTCARAGCVCKIMFLESIEYP